MAINFPSNPNVNDTHTVGSTVWTWNGTSWTGQSHDPIEIATLTYPSVDGTNGQVLTTDGAGNLTFGDVTLGSINNLSDVDITSVAPTDGQVLVWDNANSKFVPGSNAGYSDSAVDTHLNTSTATSSQVLSWDGADYAWVAQSSGGGGGGTLGASISGVEESFSVIENATGTVTHDCDNGQIFYHKTPSADWTVNLENLNLTNYYATAVTIVIQQGATAYIPNALQIGGTSTGIRWASDTTPTGNANSTDQVTFSIMTDGSTTFALGQLSTYGEGTGTLNRYIVPLYYGDRAVIASKFPTTGNDPIDYYDITTLGDATDFGLLSEGRHGAVALSDTTYGLFLGGSNSTYTDTIDYVTIASPGNAQDFGNLTYTVQAGGAACNGTYGLHAGGFTGSTAQNIDYITVATPGDASDFGDLLVPRKMLSGCGGETYGIFTGHDDAASGATVGVTMDYVTIATPGNAADFGDMTQYRHSHASTGNGTYGINAGGYESDDTTISTSIDYFSFAVIGGNASVFGDLILGRRGFAAASNEYRATFAGGNYTAHTNTIEYITIATVGNAQSFGNLTEPYYYVSGLSGSPS